MKIFSVISAAILMTLGIAGMAQATFIQTIDIYEYDIGESTIAWDHTYDYTVTPPISASLSIVADDVDGPNPDFGLDGEQDAVYINGVFLGYLTMMDVWTNFNYEPGPGNPDQPTTTTTFNLDASLIDWTMPVSVSIEANFGVEIETSTLTVSSVSVPDASMMLLLGPSIMGLALFRRKSKRS